MSKVEVIVQFNDTQNKGVKRTIGEIHDFGDDRNTYLVDGNYCKWKEKPEVDEDKSLKVKIEKKTRGRPKKTE